MGQIKSGICKDIPLVRKRKIRNGFKEANKILPAVSCLSQGVFICSLRRYI